MPHGPTDEAADPEVRCEIQKTLAEFGHCTIRFQLLPSYVEAHFDDPQDVT